MIYLEGEPKEKYFQLLLGDSMGVEKINQKNDNLKQAFINAHEIRKFEIELFWKRATHFWVFISVTLLAYGNLLLSVNSNYFNLPEAVFTAFLLLLNSTGLIASLIWIKVMKGSKFWQENWEIHINMLENYFTGNLHKMVCTRDGNQYYRYSVSKLSEWVGRLFVLAWLLALAITGLWIFFPNIVREFNKLGLIYGLFIFFNFIFYYLLKSRTKSQHTKIL